MGWAQSIGFRDQSRRTDCFRSLEGCQESLGLRRDTNLALVGIVKGRRRWFDDLFFRFVPPSLEIARAKGHALSAHPGHLLIVSIIEFERVARLPVMLPGSVLPAYWQPNGRGAARPLDLCKRRPDLRIECPEKLSRINRSPEIYRLHQNRVNGVQL